MSKIILIVLLVVGIAAGAGVTFLVLGNAKPTVVKKEEPPIFEVPMEERTINLADPSGGRYLKLSTTLVVQGDPHVLGAGGGGKKEGGHGEGKEAGGGGNPLQAVMMDCLIETASRHRYITLLTPEGKKHLKEALIKEFNKRLEEKELEVKEILFTDFVME